jgi:hypothetical protein
MPVSSPSYFPPNTSTDQITGINAGRLSTGAPHFLAGASAGNNSTISNLIVIGDNSASGGLTDNTNLKGTIVIGGQSAAALTAAAAALGAIVIVGQSIINAATHADSSVLIGQSILNGTTDVDNQLSENVLIGHQIGVDATTHAGINESVVIGYQAHNKTGNFTSTQNVVIGCQAFNANVGSNPNNVYIGFNVVPNAGAGGNAGSSQNVVIGSNADTGTNSGDNVLLGFQASGSGTSGVGQNVGIGQGVICNLGSDLVGGNVVIGTVARVAPTETTGKNVIIGFAAGKSLVAASGGNLLVIETNNSGGTAQKCLIFGQFAAGNLILGNSITGTSQDFGGSPGTNMVKLLNGTAATGANITNGGYFYVLAGVLHWVDSSGNDTTLSVPAAPTTGASTASFVATNKPGSTTGAGPVAWENRVIDGVSYQSPLWAT